MSQLLPINPETKTMSSLDLAKLCVGDTKNAHSHFVTKMRIVLGETGLPNFRDTYLDKSNRQSVCYNLPEEESCLMAMSYSYPLQKQVYREYKRLSQLEIQPEKSLKELLTLQLEAIERNEALMLENAEVKRTKAEISNKKTATAMNTASTQSKRAKKIGSELEDITNDTYLYTPTEAGKRLDMSAFALNQMLLTVGWIYIDHGVKLPTIKTENRGIFKTMNNKYQTLGITESGIEIIETELIIA